MGGSGEGGGGNGTGVDAGNGSEGIRINQQRKERVIGRARRYPSDAINKQTSWGMKTLGTPLKDWRIKLGWWDVIVDCCNVGRNSARGGSAVTSKHCGHCIAT